MTDTYRGTCFCGAVEIEARGTPIAMGYCHCASCRSHSGAPFMSYTIWPVDGVSVTRGADALARFSKNGATQRCFCARCGGHVMVEMPTAGIVDVFAATLPTLAFAPAMHIHYAEAVYPAQDDLPKMKDLPQEAGGSGEVMA